MDTTKENQPGQIRRLDEAVVNRIAAGEIIQRPSNALKELMENALDAGATNISLLTKQGGLQLLQICDNGTGIRREDLSLVCERFTTSKLKEFADLSKINTYGFRGEALASISHVAKLSILTKTRDEKCGFKASYADGKLVGKPTPCAANQGTSITVEDLFFNVPTRKRVLKSPAEEFQRIADVVSKYAIHNTGVGFSLKKTTDGGPQWTDGAKEVRTQASTTIQQNISVIYGSSIEKEVIQFELDERNGPLKFKVNGQISGVNFNTKKAISLIFINNRLVESPALKRAIDLVYGAYLPKGTHPFIYISLQIDPANVDVNVHPTKHEVHFLHQDEIVERIQRALDARLMSGNASRMFRTQAILPGAPILSIEEMELNNGKDSNNATRLQSSKTPQTQPKDMVRTDSREQKLDRFISLVKRTSPIVAFPDVTSMNKGNGIRICESSEDNELKCNELKRTADVLTQDGGMVEEQCISFNEPQPRRRTDIDRLASLQNLRQNIKSECEPSLRKLISNHSFVGCIDRQFALIQHETALYVVNTPSLSEQLFYQTVVQGFGNFSAIRLNPPAPIGVLAKLALDNTEESGWTEEDGDKTELSNFVVKILKEKREMLDDYFSLEIDENGDVCTIPQLLEGYVPFFGSLPMFLLRLATEVDWDEEKTCFHNLAKEFAKFYAVNLDEKSHYDCEQHCDGDDCAGGDKKEKWKSVFEHTLYPSIKKKLLPHKSSVKNMDIINVTNLSDLYKVFERC